MVWSHTTDFLNFENVHISHPNPKPPNLALFLTKYLLTSPQPRIYQHPLTDSWAKWVVFSQLLKTWSLLEVGTVPNNEGSGWFSHCYSSGSVQVRMMSGSNFSIHKHISQLWVWFGHKWNCKKFGALKKSNTGDKKPIQSHRQCHSHTPMIKNVTVQCSQLKIT